MHTTINTYLQQYWQSEQPLSSTVTKDNLQERLNEVERSPRQCKHTHAHSRTKWRHALRTLVSLPDQWQRSLAWERDFMCACVQN